ncbi:biopolymer transporter ExbD [bacterium]|nr:biopolymer transporter ExbD [bacterium]
MINITSLVDVIFILLIFFMVTSTFKNKSEIELDLPETGTSPSNADEKQIEIFVDKEGKIFFDGNEVQKEILSQKLTELAKTEADKQVSLNADKGVTHGKIVEIMELVQKSGLTKLAVTTKVKG